MTPIILPELGDGITKATVACWHFKEGDTLRAGDEIAEVVTDKATFLIESPQAGKLTKIIIPSGQEGKVGESIGSIE